MRHTFKKDERLCSKKIIGELVRSKNRFSLAPFRIIWSFVPLKTTFPAQVLFSVPKSIIAKAVHRNKIKRLIREAYRKNKSLIYSYLSEQEKQSALLFVYTGKKEPEYERIEKKIILILQRLREEFEKYGRP